MPLYSDEEYDSFLKGTWTPKVSTSQPKPEREATPSQDSNSLYSAEEYDSFLKGTWKPKGQKTSVEQEVQDRGIGGEIASVGARGAVGAAEMFLRATRMGQDKPGEDVGWYDKLATKGLDFLEKYKAESPLLQSKYKGGVGGAVTEGASSVVTSLAAGLPGAAAGFALGSFAPVIGNAMGAVLGYALSAGTMFGVAQYDDVLERADAAGISRKESEPAAIWSGIHEGGWEFASDIIGAKILKISGKALAPVAKKTMKAGIASLFQKSWGQIAKETAGVIGVETGSELLTGGFQSQIEKNIGLGDRNFWEGAKEAFGPAFVASVMFAGLGGGYSKYQRASTEKALVNPNVGKKKRIYAAQQVQDTLKETDKEIADIWFENAMETIESGKAIQLDQDITGLPVAKKAKTPKDDGPKPLLSEDDYELLKDAELDINSTEPGTLDIEGVEKLADNPEMAELAPSLKALAVKAKIDNFERLKYKTPEQTTYVEALKADLVELEKDPVYIESKIETAARRRANLEAMPKRSPKAEQNLVAAKEEEALWIGRMEQTVQEVAETEPVVETKTEPVEATQEVQETPEVVANKERDTFLQTLNKIADRNTSPGFSRNAFIAERIAEYDAQQADIVADTATEKQAVAKAIESGQFVPQETLARHPDLIPEGETVYESPLAAQEAKTAEAAQVIKDKETYEAALDQEITVKEYNAEDGSEVEAKKPAREVLAKNESETSIMDMILKCME